VEIEAKCEACTQGDKLGKRQRRSVSSNLRSCAQIIEHLAWIIDWNDNGGDVSPSIRSPRGGMEKVHSRSKSTPKCLPGPNGRRHRTWRTLPALPFHAPHCSSGCAEFPGMFALASPSESSSLCRDGNISLVGCVQHDRSVVGHCQDGREGRKRISGPWMQGP
jgi:hypothetical protein